MAAIQTLRNWGITITVVVALALLAFIMTDLLTSGRTLFSDDNVVGKIDGQSIKYQDYFRKIDSAEEFAKMNSQTGTLSEEQQNQVREQVWNEQLHDITFGKVFQNAGIVVTPEEIVDMAIGDHISPMLRQIFTNRQTGLYDKAQADNFLRNKNADPRAAFFWQNIEKELLRNRLMTKYTSLIRQSIYCTNAQVEVEKAKNENNADVAYVSVRYSVIPDSTINVSDSEIKSYFKSHINNFKVDATCDIEYVTFPIRPSADDRNDTRAALEALKADFASADVDAFSFASMNSDAPVVNRFLSASQLAPAISQFAQTAKAGDVYGPYADGDAFKLVRLAEVASRPDSVKARHILIRGDQKLADSLFTLVKGGADFADLAKRFSQDPGSQINGGDLGWFNDGTMVPEFNEACFTNAKGSNLMVNSQFGTHIINVQDRGVESTKYSVATIEKQVQYSSRTQQGVFAQAQAFVGKVKNQKTFDAQVDSANLVKRVGRGIRSNNYSINSLRHARELVKWAFKSDVESISDIYQCDDDFVVAVVTKKQERGSDAIENVSPIIAAQLRNEKKAAAISAATQGKSLSEIASLYKSKVDTALNVSFAANTVSGAGVEPAFVGKIVSSEVGKVFSAVEGNNAAYAFSVLGNKKSNVSEDQIRSAYNQQMQGVMYSLNRLVYDVDIEDNRYKFF